MFDFTMYQVLPKYLITLSHLIFQQPQESIITILQIKRQKLRDEVTCLSPQNQYLAKMAINYFLLLNLLKIKASPDTYPSI